MQLTINIGGLLGFLLNLMNTQQGKERKKYEELKLSVFQQLEKHLIEKMETKKESLVEYLLHDIVSNRSSLASKFIRYLLKEGAREPTLDELDQYSCDHNNINALKKNEDAVEKKINLEKYKKKREDLENGWEMIDECPTTEEEFEFKMVNVEYADKDEHYEKLTLINSNGSDGKLLAVCIYNEN